MAYKIAQANTATSKVFASADEALQQLQTDDLRVIWFHPAEDYLAPVVARSAENSLNISANT
jgi:predicted oxidoreductase